MIVVVVVVVVVIVVIVVIVIVIVIVAHRSIVAQPGGPKVPGATGAPPAMISRTTEVGPGSPHR